MFLDCLRNFFFPEWRISVIRSRYGNEPTLLLYDNIIIGLTCSRILEETSALKLSMLAMYIEINPYIRLEDD